MPLQCYTLHPDAAAWANAATTNGGTFTTKTLRAVSTFCADIERASLRGIFYRMSLFCGTNLSAALTPLYRGTSLGGTQYGNTMDTNNGPFVAGDYTETGATGGLKGNGASKYLDTGFPTNTLSDGNRHLSAYEVTRSGATYDKFSGSESAAGSSQVFSLGYHGDGGKVTLGFTAFGASLSSSTTTTGGHWLGVNDAGGSGIIYKNGVQDTTQTGATSSTPPASSIYAFAVNRASGPSAADPYGGRLGAYSIGLSMTSTQAATFYTAMQAFQAALGRQV